MIENSGCLLVHVEVALVSIRVLLAQALQPSLVAPGERPQAVTLVLMYAASCLDAREAAGASSAVTRSAASVPGSLNLGAPGAHAPEATLSHGVASEHARVGPVFPDVRCEEPAPGTTGIESERPQPVHAPMPMPRPAPQPLLLRRALAERTRWLAGRPDHSGELYGREIVDVMNTMKREWLASVDGVDKMKPADRKRAWQRHLHNTSPRCEKAIRLAIGHGVGDVDALMEIVHTGSLQNLHLRTAGRALVALARPSEDTGFQGLKERCFRLEVLSYFLPAGSKWRPVGLANVDSAVAAPRLHASQP